MPSQFQTVLHSNIMVTLRYLPQGKIELFPVCYFQQCAAERSFIPCSKITDIPLTPCFGHTQKLPTAEQCFQVAKQIRLRNGCTSDTHLINFNPTVRNNRMGLQENGNTILLSMKGERLKFLLLSWLSSVIYCCKIPLSMKMSQFIIFPLPLVTNQVTAAIKSFRILPSLSYAHIFFSLRQNNCRKWWNQNFFFSSRRGL